MSVKIYNGWRWKKKHGMFQVMEKVQEAAKKAVMLDIREMVIRAGLHERTPGERFELAHLLSRHTQQVSIQIDPYDYNRVFYVRDAGSYYLMMPWHHRDKFDYLGQIPELEEYGYWNNTDMPDGMDTRRWRARGRFWDRYWFTGDKKPVTTMVLHVIDPVEPIHFFVEAVSPDAYGRKIPKNFWTKIEAGMKRKQKAAMKRLASRTKQRRPKKRTKKA